MNTTKDIVIKNFVVVTENLCNIEVVLNHFIQNGILTFNEKSIIKSKEGDIAKTSEFFEILCKKSCSAETVASVFKSTGNEFIGEIFFKTANDTNDEPKLESSVIRGKLEKIQDEDGVLGTRVKPLKTKYWPEEKLMISAYQDRKIGDHLLVEALNDKLTQESRTTVINQGVSVSGLGGVGKTTVAKAYANRYRALYDYIIWIDCGEGSLLKSFQRLASDLEIHRENYFELKDYARKSFEVLEDFKCLIIFDNAESYVGHEGIKCVLPMNRNFHKIITSRNQDWGSTAGDGCITQFPLDVFTTKDSIEFVRNNLKNKFSYENEVKHLCELLGNLPLALQLAISTLNKNNNSMSISEYIERIKNTDHIINRTFDDYENTINKAMKISLGIIENHEQNKNDLARSILITFAYIMPDDIPMDFFLAVQKTSCKLDDYKLMFSLEEAIDLLEQYSLVTKKTVENNTNVISIHRLLQQVLRQNNESTKNESIRRILNCEGFLENKLIPYSYADEELRREFEDLKLQILDKVPVHPLFLHRRFQEATELSRLRYENWRTTHHLFTYAVCLEHSKDLKQATQIYEGFLGTPIKENTIGAVWKSFEALYKLFNDKQLEWTLENMQLHMFADEERYHDVVCNHLFPIYHKLRRYDEALKVIQRSKSPTIRNVIYMLTSTQFASYNLQSRRQLVTSLELVNGDTIWKHIDLDHASLNGIILPKDLDSLKMNFFGTITADNDHNYLITPQLKALDLNNSFSNSLMLPKEILLKHLSVQNLLHIESLKLNNFCLIILKTPIDSLSATQVHLESISFFNAPCKITNVPADELLNFENIVKMCIKDCDDLNFSFVKLIRCRCLAVLKLNHCTIAVSTTIPQQTDLLPSLKELELTDVQLFDNEGSKIVSYNISQLISKNLEILRVICISCHLLLSLDETLSMQDLYLEGCSLILGKTQISPKFALLDNVKYLRTEIELTEFTISKLLNLNQISCLTLINDNKDHNITVDLEEHQFGNIECLRLRGNVFIMPSPGETTENSTLLNSTTNQAAVTTITVDEIYDLDLSSLPQSLERLEITGNTKTVQYSRLVYFLPSLHYLKVDDHNLYILEMLQGCPKLLNLVLTITKSSAVKPIDLNISCIPKSVNRIKLMYENEDKIHFIGDGAFKVDELLLISNSISTVSIQDKLFKFQPKRLLICQEMMDKNIIDWVVLVLLGEPFESIVIGNIYFENYNEFRNSSLYNTVDKMGQCYIFEKGKGKVIEESEFKLMQEMSTFIED